MDVVCDNIVTFDNFFGPSQSDVIHPISDLILLIRLIRLISSSSRSNNNPLIYRLCRILFGILEDLQPLPHKKPSKSKHPEASSSIQRTPEQTKRNKPPKHSKSLDQKKNIKTSIKKNKKICKWGEERVGWGWGWGVKKKRVRGVKVCRLVREYKKQKPRVARPMRSSPWRIQSDESHFFFVVDVVASFFLPIEEVSRRWGGVGEEQEQEQEEEEGRGSFLSSSFFFYFFFFTFFFSLSLFLLLSRRKWWRRRPSVCVFLSCVALGLGEDGRAAFIPLSDMWRWLFWPAPLGILGSILAEPIPSLGRATLGWAECRGLLQPLWILWIHWWIHG